MKTAAFCIKHRVTTMLAFIVVVIFGVIGFQTLPLALMPNIELPMAMVYTTYTGAGPQEIENLVTKPMEQACARVAGMDEIQSVSSEGSSMVMVTFVDGTDMAQATMDMREKIDMVKGFLPDDASTPTVMAMDPDSLPVVQIGLKGADLAQLQTIALDTISPALERTPGVASVDVSGGYANRVVVDTFANRLAGYGLSVPYIAQILGAENIALPAGDVSSGSKTLTVRTDGEFSSVADIQNTLIPLPRGGSVRLAELADVRIAPEDMTAIAKIDGAPCIALSVNKQSGVNTAQVAERVKAELAKLTAENPGLSYELLLDQSDYINLSVDTVISNIVIGVLLAALVLLVFLRNLGATAVIAVSMPVCIISVFLIMQATDITMNMMSLGGMAMGVGMIVDNSIVVLENIYNYRADGKTRWEACVEGTSEVALAISASTLTTVAVFLPMALTSGLVGMMFREFSITVVAMLLASLLIALTLVPLLCYMLLDRDEKKHRVRIAGTEAEQLDKPIMRLYKRILHFFITRRGIAMLISVAMVAVFAVSIIGAGMEMMPTMDEGTIAVSIGMPVGAELSESEAIAERVVQTVHETVPEAKSTFYQVAKAGGSGMGGGSSVTVNLLPLKERERSAQEIGNALRQDLQGIAGAELSVSAGGMMDMSAMTGAAINITISGDDYALLTATADDLAARLAAIPDAIEVKTSASERVPQVTIRLNRENAARFGLTAATIGQAVRGQLAGATATKLKMNGEEITVAVRGDARSGESLDALRSIPIATQAGGSVPLSLVATVNEELAPQQIVRLNQSRTITITGGSRAGDVPALSAEVQKIVADYQMPEGVSFETGGEMEEMMKSFGSLGYALIIAIGLVYFVLASQFESFLMPIMIMAILPIGLLGALFGLPVTGHPISIPAFIGVIVLAGTVVNSSIVLVDYIKTRRDRGEDKNTAIMHACPRRVRPVLMTTLTTILGLVPMAIGMGEGSEMMIPMAIVMITGMVISTIVTLFFTPVYYSVIDSLTDHKGRKSRRAAKKMRKKGLSPALASGGAAGEIEEICEGGEEFAPRSENGAPEGTACTKSAKNDAQNSAPRSENGSNAGGAQNDAGKEGK